MILLCILDFRISLLLAQTIPAIPEPGLVTYGSVVNTNVSASGPLAAGVIDWTITGNNSTSTVATTIIDVDGQYFYVAHVAFETRHIGVDSFGATSNTLEFSAGGAIYSRSAQFNGSTAFISSSSSGNLGIFGFGRTNQGSVERVDLQVNLAIESFQDWALRYFGTTNVNPNADADGDGMTNYQEYLAGTDPLNKNSLLILTNIRPDPLDGIDVSWQSVSNKTYTLTRGTNPTQPFATLQTGIAATTPTNFFHDSSATGSGPYFYRVKLELPYLPSVQTSFKVLDVQPSTHGGINLRWSSTTRTAYSIYRSTNPREGFLNLKSSLFSTPGTNTFCDATATGRGPYFYRIVND